jgi:hypothetical protein
MRIMRVSLLAAMVILGLTASSAFAVTYQWKDNGGSPVPGGAKFGENLSLVQAPGTTIDLTVPTGPSTVATNHCAQARVPSQIVNNDPLKSLTAKTGFNSFSACDLAKIYTSGTWALVVPNKQTTATKKGTVGGIDVLVRNLAGTGANCEYKTIATTSGGHGNLSITVINGSPRSSITLGTAPTGTPQNKLDLYTLAGHSDSYTNTDAGCPPFGSVAGTLVVDTASNSTQNVTIG